MESSFQMQLVRVRDALLPRQACGHKIRYPTHRVAAWVSRNRLEASGVKLYQYRCSECDGWHLTKRPQVAAPEDFA